MIRVATPAAALHGANHQSRPLRTQMTTQCSVPIAMANVAMTIPANVMADCHEANQRSGSGQVCTDQTIAAASITGGANSNDIRTALSRLRPSRKPAATVSPERDNPGTTDMPWASPTSRIALQDNVGRISSLLESFPRGAATSTTGVDNHHGSDEPGR